jgi:hypothetical protein
MLVPLAVDYKPHCTAGCALALRYNVCTMSTDSVAPGVEPGQNGQASVEQSEDVRHFLFGTTVLISAFLLFQVQLIAGKFLLPWFGGVSAVWAACMLFYQVLLLAGYAYAHWLAVRKPLRMQIKIHLALLAVAAILLIALAVAWGSPIFPGNAWKPGPADDPILGILKLITVCIGLPFFVLSSTTPLLQHWLSKVASGTGEPAEPPYWMFALSNFGSMLGLLSYPVVVEPFVHLRVQTWFWGVGFLFFVMSCALCAWKAGDQSDAVSAPEDRQEEEPVPWGRSILWFALAFWGSSFLLSSTNLITEDVAPVPLLWVLPLAIYLITFMLAFSRGWVYQRVVFQPLFVLMAIATVIALYRSTDMPVISQLMVLLGTLFAGCMVCHGELAKLKPGAHGSTRYYLTISAGGAAGGIFVGIIAPLAFTGIWEYHITLFAIAAMVALVLMLDRDSWFYQPQSWLAPAMVTVIGAIPLYLGKVGLTTIPDKFRRGYIAGLILLALITLWLLLTGGPRFLRRKEFRWNETSVAFGLLLLGVALMWHLHSDEGKNEYQTRNFYGALSVAVVRENDAPPYRQLAHGRILHGLQYLDPLRQMIPTTYYFSGSGVGLAITSHPQRAKGQMRVGAIGLGAGTLAAYARQGDYFRFYDINPAVIELARGKGGYFKFLKEAQGKVDVVQGDARLSLEAEAERGELGKYDVIVVDAFNGDSIPIHLLTKEAMQLYQKHLRGPDSIIAVHISNLSVNLEPVTAGLAQELDLNATLIIAEDPSEHIRSDWVLMSKGDAMLQNSYIRGAGFPMVKLKSFDERGAAPVWTDDYSNVISLLKRD